MAGYKDSSPPPGYEEVVVGGSGNGRLPSYREANERTSLLPGGSGSGSTERRDGRSNRNEIDQDAAEVGEWTWTETRAWIHITRVYVQTTVRERYRQRRRRSRRSRPSFIGTVFKMIIAVFLVAGLLHLISSGFNTGRGAILPIPPKVVKVAIVGAGPAGVGVASSLAKTIQQRSRAKMQGSSWSWGRVKEREVDVQVTVFERNVGIGGRMVLDSQNEGKEKWGPHLKMQDLAPSPLMGFSSSIRTEAERLFHKNPESTTPEPTPEGLFRSKMVAFFDVGNNATTAHITRPSISLSWSNYASLLWRYGPSIYLARSLPISTVEIVPRPVTPGPDRNSPRNLYTSTSIYDVVLAGDLQDLVSESATTRVSNYRVGERYEREVLGPQVGRHLGQDVKGLSALGLAMVLKSEDDPAQESDTGMEMEEALQQILEYSNTKVVLDTEVLGINRRRTDSIFGPEPAKWDMILRAGGDDIGRSGGFDHVVFATPLSPGPLKQKLFNHSRGTTSQDGVTEKAEGEGVNYQDIYVTFALVSGEWEAEPLFGSGFRTGGGVDEVLFHGSSHSNEQPGNDEHWARDILSISRVRDIYGWGLSDLADLSSSETPESKSTSPASNLSKTNTDPQDPTDELQQNITTTQFTPTLYRILSLNPLSTPLLTQIFTDSASIAHHTSYIPQAYPLLYPRTLRQLQELRGFHLAGSKSEKGRKRDVDVERVEGVEDREGLYWTGSYEAIAYGIDAAFQVGQLVGSEVGRNIYA